MISLSSVRNTSTRRPSPVSRTVSAGSTCPRVGRDMLVPGNCTCTSPFHSETMAPAKGAGDGPAAGTWASAAHRQRAAQRGRAAQAAQGREYLTRRKGGTRGVWEVSPRVPVTALLLRNNTLTSNDDGDHLASVCVYLNLVFGAVGCQHIRSEERRVGKECRS